MNNFIYSERKDELPKMQVGFIDVICLPLYRVLSEAFPWIRPLYEGTVENRQHWHDLAEKVEMGLTWIDHDTIDKPVEEFSGKDFFIIIYFFYLINNFNIFTACSDEIKDIEFTVTTLNCTHNDQNEQVTPSHHDRHRFNSLKKTGTLAKAVRIRLTKSLYHHHQSTEQLKEKQLAKERERGNQITEPTNNSEQNTSLALVEKPAVKNKKRSKLCLLL